MKVCGRFIVLEKWKDPKQKEGEFLTEGGIFIDPSIAASMKPKDANKYIIKQIGSAVFKTADGGDLPADFTVGDTVITWTDSRRDALPEITLDDGGVYYLAFKDNIAVVVASNFDEEIKENVEANKRLRSETKTLSES